MDDFFRIPKSLCYFMVRQPTLEDKANGEQMTKGQEKDGKREYLNAIYPLTTVETSEPAQQVKSESPSDDEVTADVQAMKKKPSKIKKDKKEPKKVIKKVLSPIIEKTEAEEAIECSSREELTENEPPKKKTKKNEEKQEKVTKNVSLPKIANSNNPVRERVENPPREEGTSKKLPMKKKKREKVTKKLIKKKSKKKTKLGDLADVALGIREKNARKGKKVDEKRISYECEACARSFLRKSQLRVHMVNHSTIRSHKCDVCQKAFKRKSELTSHMELHSGIKYTCDECNFVTSSKISVRFHLRRTHQKDFRYKCDECGKNFMSNCQLKDHNSSHLGVKSFVCEICGRSYFQKSHLASHKRSVHGIVQRAMKKDHECKICNKRFASEYILQNHAGIHSRKFLCTYCGKELASSSSLQLHTRMHTGERPYQCRFCSKSFVRTNALTVHELTHSGMKPYVCDLCGKSFTQRTTMMGHRKKHPGKHPPPPPTMLSKLKPPGDSNL